MPAQAVRAALDNNHGSTALCPILSTAISPDTKPSSKRAGLRYRSANADLRESAYQPKSIEVIACLQGPRAFTMASADKDNKSKTIVDLYDQDYDFWDNYIEGRPRTFSGYTYRRVRHSKRMSYGDVPVPYSLTTLVDRR